MSHALLIFNALTGYDTVSGFVKDGQNQNCMAAQNLLLELTDALLRLVPTEIPEQSMQTTDRLYSCIMSTCMHQEPITLWAPACTDVNKTGKKLFALSRGFHYHTLL